MMTKKQQIISLLNEGRSYQEIVNIVDCSKATISYHAKKIGHVPIKSSCINRYDWTAIRTFYEAGNTYSQCKLKFGFSSTAWNRIVKLGQITPRSNKIDLSKQLIENCKHSRRNIKKKLIDSGKLPNICDICKIYPIWQDKPLVLVLDHINGINNDYRLENLRLLCPNCNSQTSTFTGRNHKKRKLQL